MSIFNRLFPFDFKSHSQFFRALFLWYLSRFYSSQTKFTKTLLSIMSYKSEFINFFLKLAINIFGAVEFERDFFV